MLWSAADWHTVRVHTCTLHVKTVYENRFACTTVHHKIEVFQHYIFQVHYVHTTPLHPCLVMETLIIKNKVLVMMLYCLELQFCFEGMEESGSEGLDDLIISKKDTFFKVCFLPYSSPATEILTPGAPFFSFFWRDHHLGVSKYNID